MSTIGDAQDFRSLWDIALEIDNGKEKNIGKDLQEGKFLTDIGYGRFAGTESSLLFAGSKNSGKTSLILRFFERDETPKPTVALEYTFGRRTRQQVSVKDIGHLWELGGGTTMLKLLNIAITPENILQNAIAVVIDLSRLDQLWNTVEQLLKAIRERVTECFHAAFETPALARERMKLSCKHLDGHADRDLLDPMPIPLIIIGGKYDLFQDQDSEQKKLVCKTLRFLAHLNGATLQFYSVKQESLILKTKALLSSFLFGTSSSKSFNIDYNKPLSVPAGMDSFEQIGMPPVKESDMKAMGVKSPWKLWKHVYCSNFPQFDKNPWDMYMENDPAKEKSFAELDIDNMRMKKDEDLDRYRRLISNRAKEQQSYTDTATE